MCRTLRFGIVALAVHQHHPISSQYAWHSRQQPAHIYHVVADEHPPDVATAQDICQSCAQHPTAQQRPALTGAGLMMTKRAASDSRTLPALCPKAFHINRA